VPYAIEIHPGLSQNKKNDYGVYAEAISIIINKFIERYKGSPLILVDNRTKSFIKSGDDILNFWKILTAGRERLYSWY
jgi:hypothetical protein